MDADERRNELYGAAWRTYRRWSRISWVLTIALLAAFFWGDHVTRHPVVLWLAIGVAAAMVEAQVRGWRCPRCRAFFFWSNPFRQSCPGCRLPKWAPNDPDAG